MFFWGPRYPACGGIRAACRAIPPAAEYALLRAAMRHAHTPRGNERGGGTRRKTCIMPRAYRHLFQFELKTTCCYFRVFTYKFLQFIQHTFRFFVILIIQGIVKCMKTLHYHSRPLRTPHHSAKYSIRILAIRLKRGSLDMHILNYTKML